MPHCLFTVFKKFRTGKILMRRPIQLLSVFSSQEDFTLMDQIGSGSSAEVFRARDNRTGQIVAFKQLFGLDEARDYCTFVREISIPLGLRIPGIVQVLGFGWPKNTTGENRPFIVTELMTKGTLADVVAKRLSGTPDPNFGPTEWTKALYGIVFTMKQFHSVGAVHRDLRPQNVFLNDQYEVKIADFGLAKMGIDIRQTQNVGSPQFMAPELIRGEGYDKSVDVYAYAVLAYTTFTNNSELDGDRATKEQTGRFMRRITEGFRLKRVPEIPDQWFDLISRCWLDDPVSRPTFAQILEEMEASDRYVIEGTNIREYHRYRDRLKAEMEPILADMERFMVNMRELKGPPTVEALANAGHPIFVQIQRAHQERPRQRAKPYNFGQ